MHFVAEIGLLARVKRIFQLSHMDSAAWEAEDANLIQSCTVVV